MGGLMVIRAIIELWLVTPACQQGVALCALLFQHNLGPFSMNPRPKPNFEFWSTLIVCQGITDCLCQSTNKQ